LSPQLPTITAPARKSSTDLGRRRHYSTPIEQAVAAARDANVKIVYVDVTAAFAGHGIGSSDPFINDPSSDAPGAVPFHPNAGGYVAYADAIAAKLPNGWLAKNKQLV
jgi:lysophospholipase L1-like esterase